MADLPPKTIVRHFDSLSEARAEAIDARVFAGLHFRAADAAAVRHGTQVGNYVVTHYLRPAKRQER
ncbi:MAG: hypothetical protein V4704_00505 [Pseudomonadota bacterium]